ncbi:MAG: TIGR04076 family protein [Clostridia bacterium]|nr:TIGR04076 family protein [Clostridia bacterium]
MREVTITVLKKVRHDDLIALYENPIEHACDMQEGMRFVTDGYSRPEGLCESAWGSIAPFAMALASGAENFYDGWMKNPRSALISCNDGFRPVSFLLEADDG